MASPKTTTQNPPPVPAPVPAPVPVPALINPPTINVRVVLRDSKDREPIRIMCFGKNTIQIKDVLRSKLAMTWDQQNKVWWKQLLGSVEEAKSAIEDVCHRLALAVEYSTELVATTAVAVA
eukprot:9191039-Pyramimonas_sp.AAC.1